MVQQPTEQAALAFVDRLIEDCIIHQDMVTLLKRSHPKATWFLPGSGAMEGIATTGQFFLEVYLQPNNYGIAKQDYRATKLPGGDYLVEGVLLLTRAQDVAGKTVLVLRFSLVCCYEEGEFLLYHLHLSLPEEGQADSKEHLHHQFAELKRADMMLKELEKSVSLALLQCKNNDHFSFVSEPQGLAKMLGYPSQESLQNIDYHTLVHPEDLEGFDEKLTAQLQQGNTFSLEYRLLHRNGHAIWVLDTGVVIKDGDGEEHIQSMVLETTEQKKQQEALRMSEERYQIAMSQSELIMFEYDVQTNELKLFKNILEQYGLPSNETVTPEDIVSKGIVHKDSKEAYLQMFQTVRDGAKSAGCRAIARHADGTLHHYEYSSTTIYSDEQIPVRAIGVRRDIGEMLKLQEENEFARSLTSDLELLCEVNLTARSLVYLDPKHEQILTKEQLLSYEQFVEQFVSTLVHKEDRAVIEGKAHPLYLATSFQQGITLLQVQGRLFTDKEPRWHELSIYLIERQPTGQLWLRIYVRDIHEDKVLELEEQYQRELYKEILSKQAVSSYEVNVTRDYLIRRENLSLSEEQLRKLDSFSKIIANFAESDIFIDDRARFLQTINREHLLELFEQGKREASCTYRADHGHDTLRWWSIKVTMYKQPHSRDICALAYVEDIHEQKLKELALQYDADHDRMTGLYNKIAIEGFMRGILDEATHGDGEYALFFIDLDNFKQINDTFGHQYGDDVLIESAQKIQSAFRTKDYVGRLGGDEFCALTKGMERQSDLASKAMHLCRELHHTYTKGEVSVTVSASIGVVLVKKGESFDTLFARADEAMYRVKKNGKDHFVIE